jgi:hypothetical protein
LPTATGEVASVDIRGGSQVERPVGGDLHVVRRHVAERGVVAVPEDLRGVAGLQLASELVLIPGLDPMWFDASKLRLRIGRQSYGETER